jgi:hypothetical protein
VSGEPLPFEAFAPLGRDLFGEPIRPAGAGPMALRFDFPPFSVLNAREGDWQERKRCWIAQGIKSDLGRGQQLISNGGGNGSKARYDASPGGSARPAMDYSNRERGDGAGKPLEEEATGTSIFDPVLTELCYKWFCPPGGQIVDPFAGGSVRGIVAGLLGFRYHGIELRAEQVAANEEQRAAICPEAPVSWHCGDARKLLLKAPPADFIFTCPPYGDLERYSDDPADLSTMAYSDFMHAIGCVASLCWTVLKEDRLAAFVVGDFRDKRSGYYRGFPSDTVAAFKVAGLGLYNEAVLITAVGSLPIRIGGQFPGSRKLGKTHQNLLVFGKGDPTRCFKGLLPAAALEEPALAWSASPIEQQLEAAAEAGEDVTTPASPFELPPAERGDAWEGEEPQSLESLSSLPSLESPAAADAEQLGLL